MKILTVGKKGREQLRRDLESNMVGHVDLSEVKRVGYANAADIARDVLGRFDAGEFDVATIFYSVFESVISQTPTAPPEQGARMSAMDNATRNAGDMIDRLTIEFNRSRQAVITNELIEIISGAEAL